MQNIRIGLLCVALLIGACGGGGASSPREVADKLSCDRFRKEETEELFVRDLYNCDGATDVYFFNSNTARDNWLQLAKEFGGVAITKGTSWVQVKA